MQHVTLTSAMATNEEMGRKRIEGCAKQQDSEDGVYDLRSEFVASR